MNAFFFIFCISPAPSEYSLERGHKVVPDRLIWMWHSESMYSPFITTILHNLPAIQGFYKNKEEGCERKKGSAKLYFRKVKFSVTKVTPVASYVLLLDSWEDFFSSCTRNKTTSSPGAFWNHHGGDIPPFDTFLSTEIHYQPLLSTDSTLTDTHTPPDQGEDGGRSLPGSPEEQGITDKK